MSYNIESYQPQNGRFLREDSSEANIIDDTEDAIKIVNESSDAYDSVNDAIKTISQGAGYKLISFPNISDIANGAAGNTDWLNDDDVKRAKVITIYYTASQVHHLSIQFDHANPGTTGHYGATTNSPYHSGSIGSLGSISQRFTFAINDGNIKIYFTNASGGAAMNITNIKVRLQF